jgi:hypothetical protein
MKTTFLFTLIGLVLFNTVNSQTQLRKWYHAPEEIDITGIPITNSFITLTSGSPFLVNGIYDLNGKLVCDLINSTFRIKKNNQIIGSLSSASGSTTRECSIVPFPNTTSCDENKFYVFYCTKGTPPINDVELRGGVLNMNTYAYTEFSSPIFTENDNGTFGGIAVGKEINGQRFLYFCFGGIQ